MITYDQYRNFPRNTGIPEHELRRKFFLLREDHLTSGKQSNPCFGYPLFPNLIEVNYGANSDDQSIYEGTSLEITNAGTIECMGRYMRIGEENGRPKYSIYINFMEILWDPAGANGAGWYLMNFSNCLYYSNDDVAFPWLVSSWVADQGLAPTPTVIQGPAAINDGETVLIKDIDINSTVTGIDWDLNGGKIATKIPSGWSYGTYPDGTVVKDLSRSATPSEAYQRIVTSTSKSSQVSINWFQTVNQLDPGPPAYTNLYVSDTNGSSFFEKCRTTTLQYTDDSDLTTAIWIDTLFVYPEYSWGEVINEFGNPVGCLIDFPPTAQYIRIKYTVNGVVQGYSNAGAPTA